MDTEQQPNFRPTRDGFRWDDVACVPHTNRMARRRSRTSPAEVLFHDDSLACELRYFEMDANGYSTLERHEHAHAVMILRGRGQCMVGDDVRDVKQFDLVTIPAWTWHQFRATAGEPFGFLCMVNATRDRPVLPNAEELARMRANPTVAAFLAT